MTLTGNDDAILEPEKSGGGGEGASPGPSAQPGAVAGAAVAEVQPEAKSASPQAPDADKPERTSASPQAPDAAKPKRKSGEDGERRRGRGRSRSRSPPREPRRDHRNRDRGRDRDDRDYDRRDSRDGRGDRHHDDRRDRRHEDRRHEDRHRSSRRSRSPPRRSPPRRSRSPRRRERKPDREPAYDKEAVAAALARAQGAINGGLLPSVAARPNLTAGVGTTGLQVRAARVPPHCARPAAVPQCADPRAALPVSQAGDPAAGASASSATPAGAALAAGAPRADGKKGARDFSFLVTEDKQDAGPNLAMLGCSDSDSDSEGEGGGPADGAEEDGFEAGSAIDQLLWRQKAVSGMETRRPGESVQQFFQRRMAGMRMLSAQAGTSSAKALEMEVDQAMMNAGTAWHWGQGDHDADNEADDETLGLEDGSASSASQLTWNQAGEAQPQGEAGAVVVYGQSDSVVAYDGAKAAVKKRQIIGSEGVRMSGAMVPRATKDCLSNERLAPLESGRGFALLEKMGWKKGEGLGRNRNGAMLPVAASVKTDMGGLAASSESYRAPARFMEADGPQLSDSFSVGVGGMLAQAKTASMDSEFSSIVSQTKSVQQINEENRNAALRAALGGPAPAAAPAAQPMPAPMPMPPPLAMPQAPPPQPHPNGAYHPPPAAAYNQPPNAYHQQPPPTYHQPHPSYDQHPPPGYGFPHQGMPGYGYPPMNGYPPQMPGFPPPMPGYPPMPMQQPYMTSGMGQPPPPWGWQ